MCLHKDPDLPESHGGGRPMYREYCSTRTIARRGSTQKRHVRQRACTGAAMPTAMMAKYRSEKMLVE